MRSSALRAAWFLSFATPILACAACAESAPGVSAPQRTAWQQFCEQAWNMQQASALVAARGAEGWELVSMYNGGLCYKRPVGEPIVQRPPPVVPGLQHVPGVRDPGF